MDLEQFEATFIGYKKHIDATIKKNIDSFGPKTVLRDACEYALINGGKGFRPMLVLMMAKALNCKADLSEAALAIEYLHTASLIADDLPCMDNDAERRGYPTVHKAFSESVALMASYALIAAGYECLAKNAAKLASSNDLHAKNADEICRLSLENVSYNTGFFGATGGQFLDLHAESTELSTIKEVICKKTVSLFEISFVLGWLFGGGEIALLPSVKKAAYHFGMAFQIADDIDDIEQDRQQPKSMNMALILGVEMAVTQCLQEISLCRNLLTKLNIHTLEMDVLLQRVEKALAVVSTHVTLP